MTVTQTHRVVWWLSCAWMPLRSGQPRGQTWSDKNEEFFWIVFFCKSCLVLCGFVASEYRRYCIIGSFTPWDQPFVSFVTCSTGRSVCKKSRRGNRRKPRSNPAVQPWVEQWWVVGSLSNLNQLLEPWHLGTKPCVASSILFLLLFMALWLGLTSVSSYVESWVQWPKTPLV